MADLLLDKAIHGDFDGCSMLLSTEIDPNIQDIFGSTILHTTLGNIHEGCSKILLEYDGQNFQQKSGTKKCCKKCINITTFIKLLLDANANPNIQNSKGWTPLHLTAIYKNESCAQLLLEYGADYDIQDNDGQTAKSIAHNQKIVDRIENFEIPIIKEPDEN